MPRAGADLDHAGRRDGPARDLGRARVSAVPGPRPLPCRSRRHAVRQADDGRRKLRPKTLKSGRIRPNPVESGGISVKGERRMRSTSHTRTAREAADGAFPPLTTGRPTMIGRPLATGQPPAAAETPFLHGEREAAGHPGEGPAGRCPPDGTARRVGRAHGGRRARRTGRDPHLVRQARQTQHVRHAWRARGGPDDTGHAVPRTDRPGPRSTPRAADAHASVRMTGAHASVRTTAGARPGPPGAPAADGSYGGEPRGACSREAFVVPGRP